MIILLLLLLCCIMVLNVSTKLAVCSLIAVLSITIANLIAEFYGKQKAIGATVVCCVLATIMNWQNFHIVYSNYLLVTFFSAITLAVTLSVYLFNSLRITMPFIISNFISVVLGSLIDTSVTCIGLLNIWSANKVLAIYFKDFIFKISYAAAITVCISLLLYIFEYIRLATVINCKETK